MNTFNNRRGTSRREFFKKTAVSTALVSATGPLGDLKAFAAPRSQSGTETRQYGKWIKPFSYQNWQGHYRQVTSHISEFPDLHIEYGTPSVAGRIGPDSPEIHDFNQVMIFMGTDTANIGDLGAEIELCLGPEKEKHMITTSTAVLIPKGTAHMPAKIIRMDRRFIIMTISQASHVTAKSTALEKEYTGDPIAGLSLMRSKYRDNIPIMLWERKGAWHYGAQNRDDAGGYITFIRGGEVFGFQMMYESINKGPYRFGDPYIPHVHSYDESLLFIGADCSDLTQLGGEYVMSMGKEMERHVCSVPSLIHLPKGFPHCPLVITKVDKPFIFVVLQGFSSNETSKAKD